MLKLLGLHSLCKHFNFLSEYPNLSFHLPQMASANTPITKAIPTIEINTIHIDNEPSIHVEHFFRYQRTQKSRPKAK